MTGGSSSARSVPDRDHVQPPTIRDGGQGLTTGLWVLAPALGYARTISRFYALGQPADNFNPDVL